jgi:capsular polysaccharide biosynthesis protein
MKLSKNNIIIFKPKTILESNYLFKNSIILPRMSNVQNYLLAKNILNTIIKKNKFSPKKVFLTSEREDRISNIYELKKLLENSGFTIVNPKDYNVFELLTVIKSADILISEKASILNNVHLVRDEKYYLLSSITEKSLNKKLFYGAGIYKEFHRGLFQEIYCEDDPINQNVRAFKKRIKVNINLLLSEIKISEK